MNGELALCQKHQFFKQWRCSGCGLLGRVGVALSALEFLVPGGLTSGKLVLANVRQASLTPGVVINLCLFGEGR